MFFSLLLAFPSAYLAYEYLPGAYRQPTQPWIFLLGAAILTVIIILTTSYQTYRAATRNPVEALRYE
jgi:putative ABC transport system permease protein